MKRIVAVFSLSMMLLTCNIAKSDTLVLIHGYLSNGQTWHNAGISRLLSQYGWNYNGHLAAAGYIPSSQRSDSNNFYTVDLPYDAPVQLQANILSGMLEAIAAQHQGEKLVLVGHSAGGVVARMALVESRQQSVKALITLASPHAGTPRAVEALDKTDSSGPFGVVKNMFGGNSYHTVRRSRGLLVDLLPPRPGNMLYWLNSRQHPEIHYISIIRQYGDELVPAYSQDMNQVPALYGKSSIVLTPFSHVLTYSDGEVLVAELSRI